MRILVVALVLGLPCLAHAQETLRASFSNSSQTKRVVAKAIYGNVEVSVHSEEDVVVQITERLRTATETTSDEKGALRRVDQGANVKVDENDNMIVVKAGSEDRFTDMRVWIPQACDLSVLITGEGDILVADVAGELEISTANGSATLTGISGPVVADAHAGDLSVALVSIPDSRPMAFSSWSGDVRVTLPEGVAATLKMRTDYGEILSDFELGRTVRTLENIGTDKRQRLRTFTYADLNGGGPEYLFQSYSGDIVIRKGSTTNPR